MITENNIKYLKAPSIDLIESVVKKFKVSESQFERFFGISKGTIKYVRMNLREMPSKFWHLFYDPQYQLILRRDRNNSHRDAGAKLGAKMVTKDTPDTTIDSKNKVLADSKLKGLLAK